MKTVLTLIISLTMILAGQQVFAQKSSAKKSKKESSISQSVVNLKISGMTCGGCASRISSVLVKVDGIISEDVSYPGDLNTITYNPKVISEKDIIATIEKTGYKAEVIGELEDRD